MQIPSDPLEQYLGIQSGLMSEYMSRRQVLWLTLGLVGAGALAGCGPGEVSAPQAVAPGMAEPTDPSSTQTQADAAPTAESKYPEHTDIVATVFWVGEAAGADNADIDNVSTEWNAHAATTFGGIDDPDKRGTDGSPQGFTPKHNDCYVALPISEFSDGGLRQGVREASPWAAEVQGLGDQKSALKGRWVVVTANGKTVYAQWLDTGPSDDGNVVNDPTYVFGTDRPHNQFGLKAGIDLSPATAFLLGFSGPLSEGSGTVSWRFVDATAVPDGRWKKYQPIDNSTNWD